MVRSFEQHVNDSGVTFVYNRDFQEKKARHLKGIRFLHMSKRRKTKRQRQKIDAVINARVMAWNEEMLRRERYYDLHGMTKDGAVDYVRMIMEMISDEEPIEFETGRGLHSTGRVPKIRTELLEIGDGRYGWIVEEHPKNPGVVVVIKIFNFDFLLK
ncbi:hypothetical protein CRE_12072 [Caenorhabditis remanei]|uniref:Smr domain-containing protein n=1 Tax=Caenorhabditis remanei TaxID=31234 RepID=E3MPR4_CAERE|nr:hypothetical protein CRE_12072 [Caenorhabditis remanei]